MTVRTRPVRSLLIATALSVSLIGCGGAEPASEAAPSAETTARPIEATAEPVETTAEPVETTIEVRDPAFDRSFEVSLWRAPSDEVDDRSHLVVISHGFGGDRTSHDYLAEALAGDGYIVAAPTHPDLAGLESGQAALDPLRLRPRHLGLVIDEVETTTAAGFDRITIIGHSMGGYTALRAVGVDVDPAGVAPHCDEHPGDEVLCRPGGDRRFTELAADADAVQPDPRIDRLVLFAPAYGPLLSSDALAAVDVPVLVVGAEEETELVGSQVADLGATIGSDVETLDVAGSHFVFVRPCSDPERSAAPAVCDDPPGLDRTTVHDELASAVSRFLAG